MLTGCAAPTVQPVTAETDIPPVDRYAALTFDDGPSPTCTPILLDGLRERGVHATFFLIGSKIDGQEELVRRMQAEGHQIAALPILSGWAAHAARLSNDSQEHCFIWITTF